MRWKTFLLPLGSLILLFSACTGTPQRATAPSVSALLLPVIYTTTAHIQSGKTRSLSLSCPSGEQMLGGGFASLDLFEYAAYIEASYPSSSTTWTVVGTAPASFFDLEADIYCSKAHPPIDLHLVHATGTTTASVACPQKMLVLGGGFSSSQPIGVSRPQGNGWMSASSATSIQVYALCVASQVQRTQVITTVFNAHSSSHSSAPGARAVACPRGQIATGGGFEGGDRILGSQTSGSSFAGWSVMAGGETPVTIFGLCAHLSGAFSLQPGERKFALPETDTGEGMDLLPQDTDSAHTKATDTHWHSVISFPLFFCRFL